MRTWFYKLDFEAWDEGTDDLTLEQEAAYLRLINHMYRRRGPIPESMALLCRLWRCHPNKAKPILAALVEAGKIHRVAEGLYNNRVSVEVHNLDTTSTRRAHAGETGGRQRGENRRKALKTKEAAEALASINLKQNEAEERRGEDKEYEGRVKDSTLIKKDAPTEPARLFSEKEIPTEKPPANGHANDPRAEQERQLFERGKAVLGSHAGGLVKRLLIAHGGNTALARSALETAATKGNPREYIGAVVQARARTTEWDPRL